MAICEHKSTTDFGASLESAGIAGDTGSVPGSGRSLEEEMATYSSILKSHGQRNLRAVVHRVTQS